MHGCGLTNCDRYNRGMNAIPASVPRYAVIGHPIAHSLSPRIHAEFARQCDRALEYVTLDAAPTSFSQAVHAFFDEGGAGLNATLPHKAAAFTLADEYSDAACRAGVANVLTRTPSGTLRADNTDGVGLLRDLRERHALQLAGSQVLLLGAGGAAHGVATALLDAGIASLCIANRTGERAVSLASALADPARVQVFDWRDLAHLKRMDLVFNSTAAGIHRQPLNLPASVFGADTVCYDLSYGPAAASFLHSARQAGATRAIDGLGMLVETAAASFALWHGIQPATESVYRLLNRP